MKVCFTNFDILNIVHHGVRITDAALVSVKQDLVRTEEARAGFEHYFQVAMRDKEHLQVMLNGTSNFAQTVMLENVNLKTHVHEVVRQATQDALDWFTHVLECKNNQLLAAQVANIDKDVTMRKWDATHSFAMVKTNDGDAKLPYYAV